MIYQCQLCERLSESQHHRQGVGPKLSQQSSQLQCERQESGVRGAGEVCTSPHALMAQDSPNSAAAAAAESDARFASAAVDAAVAAIGLVENAGSAAMDGCCAVASRGTAAAAAAVAGNGGFGADGRRRRRISLALGPAEGTRSSASRWRMRSALICVSLCGRCHRYCGGRA
jgi:hypothetical protein